ncbi:helix-turn-helix domain-containing protein [Geothrix sp.]|uniref:helix-turn-helix transcriptional regulator n=1 Tax=Geothrix sp. TaxID=1962974 RepID=UPI00344FE391
MNYEALLTRREAASFLAISPRTLELWAIRGGGPAFVKVGHLCRYRMADLQAWTEARTRQHTRDTPSGGVE